MKSPKSKVQSPKFHTSGFTIVETLVAITVLMIAIAGPLVVASKGLFGALASKDQMIAAYLAQESMETIKNIRDNNEYAINGGSSIAWDAFTSGAFDSTCSSVSATCDASAVDSPSIKNSCPMSPAVPVSGCQIYLGSNGYGHNSGDGMPTLFSRYFYTTPPTINNGNELTVTVVVNWNEGTTPYSVSLSSELTNSTR
jgi:Tfp pilus assembly protein PilV